MKDIKVIDTLKEIETLQNFRNPIEYFANAVEMTRRQDLGISIEDISKCFRYQFDEAELASLIKELNKGKI